MRRLGKEGKKEAGTGQKSFNEARFGSKTV